MTKVRDVMTEQLVTVEHDATVLQAARLMRDNDIGEIIIVGGSEDVKGVLTDRDIVVRAVADELDFTQSPVSDVSSDDPVTISADADVTEASQLMRDRAIRRLPVVEDGGRLVGIVSIGDLAVEMDEHSALAEISASSPNN